MTDIPTDGVVPHLRKLRDIIDQFGEELDALKKLETALRAANDRLDRGAKLVGLENQMLDKLLFHQTPTDKNPSVRVIADNVDRALADIIKESKAAE